MDARQSRRTGTAAIAVACAALLAAIAVLGARAGGWTDVPPILPMLLLVTGISLTVVGIALRRKAG